MINTEHLPETDPTGLQTLEQFAEAHKFNEWLFKTLLPYCKGRILEAGSGIGNISDLLMKQQFRLTVTDLREEYCVHLKKRFGGNPLLDDVVQLDLAVDPLSSYHPELIGKFDTVITSNVIEHIKEDALAVRNCAKMLAPNGHLIVLVPANTWLYNGFDKELGHYKRYNTSSLSRLMQQEGLQMVHSQYFNAVGVLGWFVSGSLLKKKIIPGGQLKLFENLVPVIKLIDKITLNKIGLSVIAVGRKP